MAKRKVGNRRRSYQNMWEGGLADEAENSYRVKTFMDEVKRPYSTATGYGAKTADQMEIVENYHRSSLKRQGFQEKMPNVKGASATSKAIKNVGIGGVGIWAGIDTVMNMKAGDDFGTAALKGIGSGMLWATMPGIMTAHMVATSAPAVINSVNQYKRQKESWWYKQHLPNFGGSYQDTRRAQTMRQAAVEAIQGSKLNARSALGGEARILSQSMYRG